MKKVQAVPAGYHNITPYLIVDDAANAIEFYKNVFGATETMRMGKPNGKVGHAELNIGDSKIMLADEFPEMNAKSPKSFGGTPVSIHLYIDNVDEVVTKAVNAGAKLARPIEDMFYGDRSGTIVDPFGHSWYISTHIEDVSEEDIKQRMAKMMDKK